MGALKYILFGIGTLAFFANVYLAVKNPDLVESPNSTADEGERPTENPLRPWDQKITWLMWGGWGGAALIGFLLKVGFLEVPD